MVARDSPSSSDCDIRRESERTAYGGPSRGDFFGTATGVLYARARKGNSGIGRRMNEALRDWVRSVADVTRPDAVAWMTGADDEARALERDLVERGTLVELDPKRFPPSFWHRS